MTSKKGLKASKSSKASKPPQTAKTNGISEETSKEVDPTPPAGRQYWLMKAEPESRLENGRDIKFSIDDLRAKTKPEPWDGKCPNPDPVETTLNSISFIPVDTLPLSSLLSFPLVESRV